MSVESGVGGRLRWASVIGVVVGVFGLGGVLTGSAGSVEPSSFVAMVPCRLADTRSGSDTVGPRSSPVRENETYVVAVSGLNGRCAISSSATAVSLNIVIISPTAASFLTVFPADADRPLASSLNWVAGQAPTSNAVTVGLAADGTMAVYNLSGSVDLVIDVVGFFQSALPGSPGPIGPPGVPGPSGPPGGTGSGGAWYGRVFAAASTVDVPVQFSVPYPSITLGADGYPVLSYNDDRAGVLKVVKCNDPACSPGGELVTVVASAALLGRSSSITLGADGNPVISYWDWGNGDLKVVKCDDPSCAPGGEVATTVDPSGSARSGIAEPSITIGVDGNPVVSYFDITSLDLKVVKCDDPACAPGGESIVTLDAAGQVGQGSSITIGADGHPVVAYTDETNADLKVVKCNDPACAPGGETVSTVDSAGLVGYSASIAIGVDANPVIVYREVLDFGPGSKVIHLKLVKCDDPACAPGGETITYLNATEMVGPASIAIAPNGNPVITYSVDTFPLPNPVTPELLLVECGDPACVGDATRLSVIETITGEGISMVIGTDGNPVIASGDTINGRVRVIKIGHTSWTPNGW